MTLLSLWRGIEGNPLLRSLRFGAEVGEAVGTYFGEQTVAQIKREGASTGPVFTQEIFDYEISAIRMGAQI